MSQSTSIFAVPIELQDVYRAISRRPIDEIGLPYKLCIDEWIKCHELLEEWLDGRPVLSADIDQPNFIIAATPVIPC